MARTRSDSGRKGSMPGPFGDVPISVDSPGANKIFRLVIKFGSIKLGFRKHRHY